MKQLPKLIIAVLYLIIRFIITGVASLMAGYYFFIAVRHADLTGAFVCSILVVIGTYKAIYGVMEYFEKLFEY